MRRSRASATTSFPSAELCRIYARAVGAKQLKTSAWPALLHALERCTASGDSPPATYPIDSVEAYSTLTFPPIFIADTASLLLLIKLALGRAL
jgi:hypothetical protein